MMSREELRTYLLKRADDMLSGHYQASALTDEGKGVLMAEKALWQFDNNQTLDRLIAYMTRDLPKVD